LYHANRSAVPGDGDAVDAETLAFRTLHYERTPDRVDRVAATALQPRGHPRRDRRSGAGRVGRWNRARLSSACGRVDSGSVAC